jgi:hypothetical protein
MAVGYHKLPAKPNQLQGAAVYKPPALLDDDWEIAFLGLRIGTLVLFISELL